MSYLSQTDPEIADIIEKERLRQTNGLELIASENVVSRAVLEAMGSIMTNKYAEGYPGKRYYGGCEFHDMAENLARDRLKKLFGAEHANVQPHSGTQANMAVYMTLLKPGDAVLGMNLAHGGHLTHGEKVSFSGKSYNFITYGVNRESGRIDYRELEKRYRQKAVSILKESDKLEKGTDVDEEIEKQVAELRKRKGRFCSQCGTEYQEGDRFCSRCGAKLKQGGSGD